MTTKAKPQAAHTPGPWKVREWPKPNIDGPFLKIGIRRVTESFDGGEFATVEALHTTVEADANARANARLIAAAPDLLAAAKRVANELRHMGHDDGEEKAYAGGCAACALRAAKRHADKKSEKAESELLSALRDLRDAATDAYKSGRIPAEPFVRAGNVIAKSQGEK